MTTSGFSLSRRAVIGGTAAAAVGRRRTRHVRVGRPVRLDYPFTLGVASGDPGARSGGALDPIRAGALHPEPRHARADKVTRRLGGGGRRGRCDFVVTRGQATTYAAWAHSVHVDAKGLRPGARVLVPLRGSRSREPRRPDPDRARRPGTLAESDLRVGVVPGLRLRLLHVLPAHRRGRPRLRAAPRRLRLRVRRERDVREPRDARCPRVVQQAPGTLAVAGHARPLQAGPAACRRRTGCCRSC